MLAFMQYPAIAELVLRGNAGERLSSIDWMRYREWVRSLMSSHQTFFFAHNAGLESEELWQHWRRTFRGHLSMPGFANALRQVEADFDPGFRAYITESMAEDR